MVAAAAEASDWEAVEPLVEVATTIATNHRRPRRGVKADPDHRAIAGAVEPADGAVVRIPVRGQLRQDRPAGVRPAIAVARRPRIGNGRRNMSGSANGRVCRR